jgi:5-methylcytosine-specific restriction endonuclease McrA
MAFSEPTKTAAWKRSGQRCECRRKEHGHLFPRCLIFFFSRSQAEFHHLTTLDQGGDDTLSNCQVLCKSCHRKTDSYGHH